MQRRLFSPVDRLALRCVFQTAQACGFYEEVGPEMLWECLQREPPRERLYAEYLCRLPKRQVRIRLIGSLPEKRRWTNGWVVTRLHSDSKTAYASLNIRWQGENPPRVSFGEFGKSPFGYTLGHEGDPARLYLSGPGLTELLPVKCLAEADRCLEIVETAFLLGQVYGPANEPFAPERNEYGLTGKVLYQGADFRPLTRFEAPPMADALNRTYAEGTKLSRSSQYPLVFGELDPGG